MRLDYAFCTMKRYWRPLTRREWQFAAGMAILIWCACSPARPTPLNFNGDWSGTTSQGRPIRFSVQDVRVIAVTVEYAFGGCAGSLTIPADAILQNTSGTADAVVTYTPNGPAGARTTVNFLFTSPTSAHGTAQFTNYPTCGDSNVTWTANKP